MTGVAGVRARGGGPFSVPLSPPLPVDVGVARRWGLLSAEIGHDGADLLIAATALERGLTVVTRNLRHFAPTGVPTVNPWSGEGGS